MQLSIYMADNIGKHVKSRLPYDCDLSLSCTWFLLGATMTPAEMAEYCKEHPKEAAEVQPLIIQAFERLFGAFKGSVKTAEAK